MIELQLKRIAKRPTYTIGRLSIRRREHGVFTPQDRHPRRPLSGRGDDEPKVPPLAAPARRRAPLRGRPHPQRQHRPGHPRLHSRRPQHRGGPHQRQPPHPLPPDAGAQPP